MSAQPEADGAIERQPTQVTVTPREQSSQQHVQEMFPRSYVDEIRQSDAKHRIAAKEATARAEAAEKEIARLKPLEVQIRGFKVRDTLAEVITKAGGNVKITSKFISDDIAALDPDDKNFSKSLAEVVEKAIKDNPELKAAPAAGQPAVVRAGSDISHPNTQSPSGGDGQWTEAELASARKEGRHEDIQKALSEGKLKTLMNNRAAR